MSEAFFERPILNSPYERPSRHWELDNKNQPTHNVVDARRRAAFLSPIPRPHKRTADQKPLALGDDPDAAAQNYTNTIINQLRGELEVWRALAPSGWGVTPETSRLLQHWRTHQFAGPRPFFCQLEAVETAIWLTEVAPGHRRQYVEHLARASEDANPGLLRLSLKLATGAGKTTVMAMLIAWQTVNALRYPQSRQFTRGFLIVTPGLTIKDRLRVLQPNDPDSYYAKRELVPSDMLGEVARAKVVITNFHAFKLRERVELSKGGRALLRGRGPDLATLETPGQMVRRVMPSLAGIKHLMVLNDEAHHCYRERPSRDDDNDEDPGLTGEARKEAEQNSANARLWISGLEMVGRVLGVARVIDLSATPFFLSGSGYREGTLFPWTMSDFSLMDAIECGIVKLPRVPVADNLPGDQMPMYRDLWAHIRKQMPRSGRAKGGALDPLGLPAQLLTALEALYGHYEKTFALWQAAGVAVPPCFIVVCQNTAISKLVYDYISGFRREDRKGNSKFHQGRLSLFRNFDDHGEPLERPRTLLIDSEQLESGELDDNFREMFAEEIARFRREIAERGGVVAGEDLDDVTLLREVMNTVGRPGQLGASIRCVVSVSMLTEGWDTNTVTHVLGVRAFGTQLLCEQVIGRALRRRAYDLNAEGLFDVEYADVLGIPFDFTAKAVIAPPQAPRETVHVKAMRPERDALEIRFPRVSGYRVDLPEERLTAEFTDDSTLVLTPELVGATRTRNAGIIGAPIDLDLAHTSDAIPSHVLYELVAHLIFTRFRDGDGEPQLYLFGQLKRIARQWLDAYLVCKGGTFPAQLRYKVLADVACEHIVAGITRAFAGKRPITAVLDAFNPVGSTSTVSFLTSRDQRWKTDPRRCHVNWLVLDSSWEAELCRAVEAHPRVRTYIKNHNLGFEVPYRHGNVQRQYRPDFIVLVDDGRGDDDLLRLVIEIKGYRGEDAKAKKETMDTQWIPAVNHEARFGRWAFAELTDVYEIESDLEKTIATRFDAVIAETLAARR